MIHDPINVTDPFDLYQFFTNQCYVYLQLLLIGIGLVIKAPKSPEFTYTVFHGIALYYLVFKHIQKGGVLTIFFGFWRFLSKRKINPTPALRQNLCTSGVGKPLALGPRPPFTLLLNSQFLRPTTNGRIAFSARLLSMGIAP